MLDGAPAWTTISPNPSTLNFATPYNNPNKPEAPKYWRDYVEAMISHYRGRIDNWEAWNEPWGEFFPGSSKQYANLLKSAYMTSKAANPSATIIEVDAYRYLPNRPDMKPDFAKNVLKASGSAYFDAFSYHDYTPSAVAGPQDNVQLNEARDFRSLQLRSYQTAVDNGGRPGIPCAIDLRLTQ